MARVSFRELLASGATAALCGCAFTDVELEPVTAFEQVSRIGRGREVLVQQFVDARPEQDRCGMKKNGYNADTANVLCPDPNMGNWLSWMFAARLKSAGFAVGVAGQQRSPDPLFVEGRLEHCFVEPVLYFFTATIEADIGIQLVARTRSGMAAERRFFVKADDSNFWGTDAAFQISFEQATQGILTSMTNAVAQLMDRHPGMGVAATPVPSSGKNAFWLPVAPRARSVPPLDELLAKATER